MASRTKRAVMYATVKQYQKVIDRASRVLAGLFGHPIEFPSPPVTKANFEAQLKKAKDAQAVVKGGGKKATAQRNHEVELLFAMLKPLLLYTNLLYTDNIEMINDSGFALSADSSPLPVPKTPLIKRVDNGWLEHSARIILFMGQGNEKNNKDRVTYIVQMAYDGENEEDFRTVAQETNMHKLLISGLVRGKEVFFRVAARNTAGISFWSFVVSFIPQ